MSEQRAFRPLASQCHGAVHSSDCAAFWTLRFGGWRWFEPVATGNFARPATYQLAFILAMFFFVVVVISCLFAVISRALDFRLTARKARGRHDLTLFCLNKDHYGHISWGLFWLAVLAFLFGALLFLVSVGGFAFQKLLCGA